MKVLTEYYNLSYDVKTIKEQAEKNSPIVLSGIFQQADVENGNGRRYPSEVLKREVKKYQDLIKERRSVAELDHTDSPVIALERVSHLVVELNYNNDDGKVFGRLEVLNTPMGKIAQELLSSGVSIGISSRGVGSVISEGDTELVDSDYSLLGFDLVSCGSVENSWLQKEAKEYFGVNIRYPSTQDINRLLTKEARLRNVLTEILQK